MNQLAAGVDVRVTKSMFVESCRRWSCLTMQSMQSTVDALTNVNTTCVWTACNSCSSNPLASSTSSAINSNNYSQNRRRGKLSRWVVPLLRLRQFQLETWISPVLENRRLALVPPTIVALLVQRVLSTSELVPALSLRFISIRLQNWTGSCRHYY